MKKLAILLSLLMLFGCGSKIHENVSQDMAKDTEQVFKILQSNKFTEDDEKVFREYLALYGAKYELSEEIKSAGLTAEERRIWLGTSNLVELHLATGSLDSRKGGYKENIAFIRDIIKNGND